MTYLEILRHLIACDTTTGHATPAAVEWIASYLKPLGGVATHRVRSADGARASLIICIGEGARPLLLSGHLDVVPAGAGWTMPPFALTETPDKVFGRGTTDMKGAIAVALSLIPDIVAHGKSACIVLTPDEEVAGTGVHEALDALDRLGILPRAAGCIVMEPTGLEVLLGQKESVIGVIEVHGKTAHSSDPAQGANALAGAMAAYGAFYGALKPFQDRSDAAFQVPHCVADITLFQSGIAANMIPDKAEMAYSGRFLDAAQKEAFMRALSEALMRLPLPAGVSVAHRETAGLRGFATDAGDAFARRILTHAPMAAYPKVSYGTEAGCFSARGIPTLILGPGRIAQAHQPDEFIEKGQLDDWRRLLWQIVLDFG
ncbi:MAG: M20/M25/M40 family metallo-hydrolase [Alphaproteobacteria bacterium]|nr:M20/M25/M40 family metallo-hydrolase [Alphaproteobacteria bacterium]